jgi:hypothetical protein
VIAVGDALCHTDPAFAWGLSFALVHAQALAGATAGAPDAEAVAERYRADAGPEARERHGLACRLDATRALRWAGEPLELGPRGDGYPLFSFASALAAAPHDDGILRSTIRRIGLLDRTDVFDRDGVLHERIVAVLGGLSAPPPGPPREELLARLEAAAPGGGAAG